MNEQTCIVSFELSWAVWPGPACQTGWAPCRDLYQTTSVKEWRD